MIECTNAKILKGKNRGKRKRRFFHLFIAAVMIAVCFLYSRFFISETLAEVCADYTYAYGTEAVNAAIYESFSGGIEYSEIISVEKNAAGDITLMSADAVRINAISQSIVEKTRTNLSERLHGGIPVPWLAFTGIKLLAGYGKEVNFKAISIAGVTCEFDSVFVSVGINQTLHSVYALINWEVSVDIPLDKKIETGSAQVLISEAVLVGKVPEIYLNGKLFP